ncbi:MAG TPA: M1 family metallopeptidase [Cytophagaceae bacterium]
MNKFFPAVLFLFLFSQLYAQRSEFGRADSLRGSLSPLRTCFDVYSYKLDLTIDIGQMSIAGTGTTYFNITSTSDSIQLDLFRNLTIDSIVSNGIPLKFNREEDAVFIKLPGPLTEGAKDSVTVYYKGQPLIAERPPWDGGFVWAQDSLGRPWVGVACEGIGASLWWPCKDHPSDEPDSITMSFNVPSGLTCVSNGTLVAVDKTSPGLERYTWKVHYPINLYNVTLNIAHYAHFQDKYTRPDGSALDLDYYVLSYNLAKAKEHFKQVKTILKCYEKYFGNYPFEKDGYALVETPYWGMEHQGAIAYGNKYKKNVGELDYIILHETGHEWWGNSVSTADHAELWIHESFTTYGEALLVECLYGYKYALDYLEKQKPFIENKEPILGPKNVNFHYWEDSDMYYKGAWMLHTLRNVINDDSLWFDIIYGLSESFKYQVVTTEDIINYFNDKTGKDLSPVFYQYLTRASLPVLEIKTSRKKKQLTVEYRWAEVVPGFAMPVEFKVGDETIRVKPVTEGFQKEVFRGKGKNIAVRTDLFYTEVRFLD